jgi:hypothetical protein
LFEIKENTELFFSKQTNMNNYMNMLLEYDKSKLRHINKDNFNIFLGENMDAYVFSDLRVLILDNTGKIPEHVKFNILTVATLMQANLIEIPIGKDYIEGVMSKYGKTYLEYTTTGRIQIGLFNSNTEMKRFLTLI